MSDFVGDHDITRLLAAWRGGGALDVSEGAVDRDQRRARARLRTALRA